MRLLLLAFLPLACGIQRSSSSATDVHGGEIDCHGVLAPLQGGGKKAILLCTAGRAACEASKSEQAKKGLEVFDCAPHPWAACFPNGTGQMCLASMQDCHDFAEAVDRDPSECTAFDSDAPATVYSSAYTGHYDTDRGKAVVLQRGTSLEVAYARGRMICQILSTNLACAWDEKGAHGRARFAHNSDGAWIGTYGSGHNETGAAWTFHRHR
jgi:hypothetical protein